MTEADFDAHMREARRLSSEQAREAAERLRAEVAAHAKEPLCDDPACLLHMSNA